MALFDIVESRQAWTGRIAAVRVDQVQLPGPDGAAVVAAREVVEHDLAVAVVAIDSGSEPTVVLIEQYRHPLGHRLWELPAGLMDLEGEPAVVAAQRELAEESGIAAARWEVLLDVAPSPGFTTEAVRIFLARELSEIDRPGEITHEEADLRTVRVPLADAVFAVLDGRIVNASAVAGLLAADKVLRDGLALRPGAEDWAGPSIESSDRPDLSRDTGWA